MGKPNTSTTKTMGDRYNIHSQLEHLQSKYIGTGHADTSRYDWLSNQHRDSYASYVGHFDLLNYITIAENETKARVRFNFMRKCFSPVDLRQRNQKTKEPFSFCHHLCKLYF